MKRLIFRDSIQGLLFIAIGGSICAVSIFSYHPSYISSWLISPALFPIIIGAVIVLLGSILLLKDILSKKMEEDTINLDLFKVVAITLLAVLFTFLLSKLHPILLAPFFLSVSMYLLGERSIRTVALTSLGVPFGIYVIFFQLLKVSVV